MQITHHTDQQIEKTNVPRFLQTMKALAPRSYEKAFKGMDEEVVIFAMGQAIKGLTKQQLQVGLDAMFEQGYCPDPIMFRKWCLGIKGIGEGINPIHASYRARNAALANIEAWMVDSTIKITNAEREAYNRCYGMFNDLKWNYSDKQKFHTYAAFKDFYDEVVKELVEKGESQSIWVEPPVIPMYRVKPRPKDYLGNMTDEQKESAKKMEDEIKKLIESGMSQPAAMLKVLREHKNET